MGVQQAPLVSDMQSIAVAGQKRVSKSDFISAKLILRVVQNAPAAENPKSKKPNVEDLKKRLISIYECRLYAGQRFFEGECPVVTFLNGGH